jgi:hypothetical protein
MYGDENLFHAPVSLAVVEILQSANWLGGKVVSRAGPNSADKGNISYWAGIETSFCGSPYRSLVAVPTELSRFLAENIIRLPKENE